MRLIEFGDGSSGEGKKRCRGARQERSEKVGITCEDLAGGYQSLSEILQHVCETADVALV